MSEMFFLVRGVYTCLILCGWRMACWNDLKYIQQTTGVLRSEREIETQMRWICIQTTSSFSWRHTFIKQCLFVYLSIYPSIYPSIHPSIHPSIQLLHQLVHHVVFDVYIFDVFSISHNVAYQVRVAALLRRVCYQPGQRLWSAHVDEAGWQQRGKQVDDRNLWFKGHNQCFSFPSLAAFLGMFFQ